VEVSDISPGKVAASVAAAPFLYRPVLLGKLTVTHLEPTLAGEGSAVPAKSGRDHAVEEIGPCQNSLNNVKRSAGSSPMELSIISISISFGSPTDKPPTA